MSGTAQKMAHRILPCIMRILIFPSMIWAKYCVLYTAKCGSGGASQSSCEGDTSDPGVTQSRRGLGCECAGGRGCRFQVENRGWLEGVPVVRSTNIRLLCRALSWALGMLQ